MSSTDPHVPASRTVFEQDHVTVVADADGVAVLRVDRPPLNALSRAVQDALGSAAGVIAADPAIRSVVLSGGERAFAAGADIKEMAGWGAAHAASQAIDMHRAFDAVAAIPVPVIAAICGVALGGGCELALCADVRVAADDAGLGQPEVRLGLIPGAGGTQRLARLVGPSRAKDLVLTGRRVGATEALALGLVDRVVPAAEVHDTARAWARELADGPRQALIAAKRAIDTGLDGSLGQGLALERDLFAARFGTAEQEEGFSAFLAKRSPEFPR